METAAGAWLRLLDYEQFRDTYAQASASFQAQITREMWIRRCRAWQSALGIRVNRKFLEITEIPGSTSGEPRIYLRYEVRLRNGTAVETVRMEPSEQGTWAVADYSIGQIRAKR
jgi:hypothetical protein